jgi:hypothetical protein
MLFVSAHTRIVQLAVTPTTRHADGPGKCSSQIRTTLSTAAWRQAELEALTEEEYASPLARRAYHLRHAGVSTWLNGSVAPTQVAEWAGHSVAVLLQIYTKCIAGQEDLARQRIADALGLGQGP